MPGSRASSSLGINGSTWGGGAGAGRDPRGRARSRDYLKQYVICFPGYCEHTADSELHLRCLQEITYLTSSTTLNPLAPTSYAAPNVSRPRKTLHDLPPPSSASQSQPGLINLPAPLPPPLSLAHDAGSASSGPPTGATSATALTNFPSDPASAFVPLKRQISLPLPAASTPPTPLPPSPTPFFPPPSAPTPLPSTGESAPVPPPSTVRIPGVPPPPPRHTRHNPPLSPLRGRG